MKTSLTRTGIITTALISAIVLSVGVASACGAGKEKGSNHMFEKTDANKDGKITRTEAKTVADERFNRMDGNQDGAVTQEEAKAAWEKLRTEHQAKRAERGKQSDKAKQGKRGEGHKAGHGGGHAHSGGKFFAQLDANKDGKVTRVEAEKFETDHFTAVDTNKDGAITQAEAKAHHEAMMKKWQEKRAERSAGKDKSK